MLRGEGESHTGTEPRAQKHGLAEGEVLGQNSSPALKQLGPMTGPSRAIGPLLFSANSGHIPARLSDSVMRVKRQLKQHDYLYRRNHPFRQGAALSVNGTAEALVSVVACPGQRMSLPTLLEHRQHMIASIRCYSTLGLMP